MGSSSRSAPRRVSSSARGGLGHEGIDPDLGVARPGAPRVLVLGPVRDQDQEPGPREPVHQAVEEGLRLLFDALQVLDDQHHRLPARLGEQQVADRVLDATAALRRIELPPRGIVRLEVGQRVKGRDGGLERGVERHDLGRDLLADHPRVVPRLNLEVAPERLDHRQPRRGSPVGDRPALEHQRARGPRPFGELADDPRLADPGLADQGHHAPVPAAGQLERLAEPGHLLVAAHEAREAAHGGGLQAVAGRPRPGQLVHLDRLRGAPHRHRPEGRHRDVALGQAPALGGEQRRAGTGEPLHLRGQVRRLADRGVLHAQVAANRAHHHLARVEPDADLHVEPLGATQLAGQATHALVHAQRRVGRAHHVVLVGHRGAEDRHDPVAQHLVDGALVPVHRLHHQGQHRIQHAARVLRIAVGQQLERALHVREEHGHLLALALHRPARGPDLLGQVRRGIGVGGGEAIRDRGGRRDRLAAPAAEARPRLGREAAAGAHGRERLPALHAVAMAGRVRGLTVGAGERRRAHAATTPGRSDRARPGAGAAARPPRR
jgi:hypothetical protein